jgi:FkbM family methyltransferase
MEKITLEKYERLDPRVIVKNGDGAITFCTPNRHTAWRVNTLFTKEPDTIEWISTFSPDEIFIDIGANVGMYSLWAAYTRGVIVYAFEPESQNYALLNKNIMSNKLDDKIVAYCVALSDSIGFSKLYLSEFIMGGSCHNFGEAIDFKYEPLRSKFQQGCLSSTLDNLVTTGVIPIPQHIKIDVDGIEPKVISGARNTLSNSEVKSVLIEINTNLDEHREMVGFMTDAGFGFSQDQVAKAQRKDGVFKGIGNYVFRR